MYADTRAITSPIANTEKEKPNLIYIKSRIIKVPPKTMPTIEARYITNHMIVTSNNLFTAYFLLWIIPYHFVFVKSYFQILVFFKHRIVTKSHRFNKKIFIPDFSFCICYNYFNSYYLVFIWEQLSFVFC